MFHFLFVCADFKTPNLNAVVLYGEVMDIASVEFCGKIEEQEVTKCVDSLEGGQNMKQDSFELLAGAGYGFVEGITESFVPASKGVFSSMDKSIKSVSGTADVGRNVGKFIANGLICLILL